MTFFKSGMSWIYWQFTFWAPSKIHFCGLKLLGRRAQFVAAEPDAELIWKKSEAEMGRQSLDTGVSRPDASHAGRG
jgi:hypothetical protein